jgi:hypothetical protein
MPMRGIHTHLTTRDRAALVLPRAWLRRSRGAAALALSALLTVTLAACTLAPQNSTPAAAQVTTTPGTSSAICGTPPCDKYLSRGATRTLDDAISGHPIASAIALHLVVSAFCGGILCGWGEGVSFIYIKETTHRAAQDGECLRVHVLPRDHAWQLVSLDASNQSPYCKN